MLIQNGLPLHIVVWIVHSLVLTALTGMPNMEGGFFTLLSNYFFPLSFLVSFHPFNCIRSFHFPSDIIT
jgi:hypothetical protein